MKECRQCGISIRAPLTCMPLCHSRCDPAAELRCRFAAAAGPSHKREGGAYRRAGQGAGVQEPYPAQLHTLHHFHTATPFCPPKPARQHSPRHSRIVTVQSQRVADELHGVFVETEGLVQVTHGHTVEIVALVGLGVLGLVVLNKPKPAGKGEGARGADSEKLGR